MTAQHPSGWSSLRAKVIFQAALLSAPLLFFGFLTVHHTRNVAHRIDLLFSESSGVSNAVEESLVKLAEGSYHARNRDRLKFEEASMNFDLLMKALAWGTDSQVFRLDNDGDLYDRWIDLGWKEKIGEVHTSEKIRQRAGEISLYYGGFSKYMLRQLHMLEKSEGGEKLFDESMGKASRYEQLVVQNLRKLLDQVSQEALSKRQFIVNLQFRQMQSIFLLAVLFFSEWL